MGRRSRSDKGKNRIPRETRTCAAPGCTNSFICTITSKRKYCCRGHSRKGKLGWSKGLTKKTNSSVAAMAKKLTGRKQPEEINKKRSKKLKGKTYIELYGEEKAKIVIQLRSKKWKGEGSPAWKGGMWNDPYPDEFNKHLKKSIKTRDDYICQLCGKTQEEEKKELGRGLAVHHIDYNKENCSSNNLITLCCLCNNKVNYNRDLWQAVLLEKVCTWLGTGNKKVKAEATPP